LLPDNKEIEIIPRQSGYCDHFLGQKILISQSITWVTAIFVISIVDEKQFAILVLVILATVSLMNSIRGQ